jgi:CDP-diacylglycerol--glycerol-3-phosphate 3-phosphatidyltransferase
MVTNMGKFLDPLADKLLVSAALIVLVELNDVYAPSWIVIIIISREFAVTGLRLLLAGEGEVVAANMLGKIKTWAQIVAISALLLHNIIFAMIPFRFDVAALWVALIFTVWSGWDYFAKNSHILKNSK